MLLRAISLLMLVCSVSWAEDIPNRLIDYTAFEKQVSSVGAERQGRRLSEADFLRMAAEPGTVVLDARSAGKFALLHVYGYTNVYELGPLIDIKSTKIRFAGTRAARL